MVDGYDPVTHWTSDLRVRAGLPSFEYDKDVSPFTLADARTLKGVTDFLLGLGHEEIAHRGDSYPSYHFEVAVSGRDTSCPFVWSLSQLKRVSVVPSFAKIPQLPKLATSSLSSAAC